MIKAEEKIGWATMLAAATVWLMVFCAWAVFEAIKEETPQEAAAYKREVCWDFIKKYRLRMSIQQCLEFKNAEEAEEAE